ncbi:GDSL esterase/lipase [Ananas comosus]|uniref:GDSL esterase/lipase n=1 Tax=Ananas comosus TaxID=4615 RepID=A0A199VGI5_ANACO|nr:GDSL esterase/lipase [Ananas comosus]
MVCAAPALSISILLLQLLIVAEAGVPTHGAGPVVPAVIILGDSIMDPASELGVKETLPAYLGTKLSAQDLLTGVSFASAGTGFDPATATLASVIPMRKQLEMFAEYEERLRTLVGEEKAASIIAESQFVVCAGSNDVVQFLANPLNNRTSKGIANYSKFLMQSNSRIVQDCLRLDACQHNEPWSEEFIGSALTKAMNLHRRFEESKKGCCGTGVLEAGVLCNSLSPPCSNPSQYVFWDSYHPTERANKVMVDKVVKDYLHFLQ